MQKSELDKVQTIVKYDMDIVTETVKLTGHIRQMTLRVNGVTETGEFIGVEPSGCCMVSPDRNRLCYLVKIEVLKGGVWVNTPTLKTSIEMASLITQKQAEATKAGLAVAKKWNDVI